MYKIFYMTFTEQEKPGTCIRLLEDIQKECTFRIILHKKREKFPIRKAVRRGDPISPKYYSLEGKSHDYGKLIIFFWPFQIQGVGRTRVKYALGPADRKLGLRLKT